MNPGRRAERPAVPAAVVDDFGDLIGQLFVNAAIGLGFKLTLGDGSGSAMRARAFGDRKSSGQVGYLVDEFAVRVRDIEGLDQFQTRPASRRLVDLIGFQAAAICYDDERSRYHKQTGYAPYRQNADALM